MKFKNPFKRQPEFSLTTAIRLAAKQHEGQVDKAGQRYILHPLHVMLAVADEGYSELVQMAAVLHDTVEDTNLTLADLRKMGAPEEVIAAVDSVSHRDNEHDAAYMGRVKANMIGRIVKLADMAHNSDLSRIANPTPRDEARSRTYLSRIKELRRFHESAESDWALLA